jgi:hypothetical protein
MPIIHLTLVLVSWALWDHTAVEAGRWNRDCNSPELSALDAYWMMFNIFGLLGLLVPAVIFYLSTKDLKDREAAKNWRYLSILFLSGSVYYYLMVELPGIIAIFFMSKTKTAKISIRLLVVPALNFADFFAVNWSSKNLKVHDPTDSVYCTMAALLLTTFFSRFMQNSLSSYEGTIILNSIVGLHRRCS